MIKEVSKEDRIKKELSESWIYAEWLSNKIMEYLEGGHGLTADQLYNEEDDDKHMAMRHQIADAIDVDFDEVDYAISKMFF